MPRLLLLTTEPLPIPGVVPTGAGMRAWGLGFGLKSAGFSDVTMAFAADAVRGRDGALPDVPGVATFERAALDDFIASRKPDAVIFQHWGLVRELRRPLACPMAIDLAGPHLLERQLWGSPDPAADLREKLAALSRADFTLCSGEFQRHYFLPFLVQAGKDPRTLECPVIPFSLSPDLPDPDPRRDHALFVYAGMFLPWQDPEATLRTVVGVLEERQRGKLLFIGGPHPGGDVSGGRFDALLEYLQASPRVEIAAPMPFDQLLGRLRSAGTAIDLMPRNAERELAFPTRTLTYLWAGLPIIHNDYDELADPIRETKAGWTLDARDTDGLAKLVQRLVGHREDVLKRSDNARALVRERYTWDRTIAPLAEWCRDPRPAAERRAPLIAVSVPGEPAETPAPKPRDRRPPRSEGRITYSPPSPTTDTDRGPWYLSPVVFALALPVSIALLLLFGVGEAVRLLARRR